MNVEIFPERELDKQTIAHGNKIMINIIISFN